MSRRWLPAVALGLAGAGCGPAIPVRTPYSVINGDPERDLLVNRSTEEWQAARAWVATERAELPQKPYVERVRLSVVDPRTQKEVHVRGAIAVAPDRAARLVLVGPGGGTALDAWVTPDRYRVEIPALHLTRRGGREAAADARATLGLPVGFLRWWFLAPLGGKLIDADTLRADTDVVARRYRFRQDDATVEIAVQRSAILAIRRARGGHVEGVKWESTTLAPHTGSRAMYQNPEVGLNVDVVIEEVMTNEPEPAAFEDPDLAEGS